MKSLTIPGLNTTEERDNVPYSFCLANALFIYKRTRHYYTFADVGERSRKIKAIEDITGRFYNKLTSDDFNWDDFREPGKYDVITCLETIEHVQNALFFMNNIKNRLNPGGRIFLSTPGRPFIFYSHFHFFEMYPKRLNKWILEPLGLEIVSKKRLRIAHPWWFYLTGIRPFLRLYFGYTNIYEIKLKP